LNKSFVRKSDELYHSTVDLLHVLVDLVPDRTIRYYARLELA
jgi:hypothetical protein